VELFDDHAILRSEVVGDEVSENWESEGSDIESISREEGKPMPRLTHLIPVTSNYMNIASNCPQIIERLSITHIASADDLLYFTRNKKLSKLVWQIRCTIGKVQVA